MDEATDNRVFEIKKYPNRRFYNVTSSRHETLNDLHELVKAGNEIRVIDSKTGHDITNIVLTQIILEHDPPKLDLFPATLLHQAIQANQQMVRRFIEQYFAQAVDAFSQSRKQFEDFLKKSGFSSLTPSAPFDWVRMLFPGMGNGPAPANTSESRQDDVRALREQVAKLSDELTKLHRSEKRAKKSRASRRTKS